jgi:hypothetical protein
LNLIYNDANGSPENAVAYEVTSAGDGVITPSGGDLEVIGDIKGDTIVIDAAIKMLTNAGANRLMVSNASGIGTWATPVSYDLANLGSGSASSNQILIANGTGGVSWGILSGGISVKNPVTVVATSNLDLSGEETIDGVLTSASRVLVIGQSTSSQNGIYISGASTWSRETDADSWAELYQAYVAIQSGTVNGGAAYFCTIASTGTINTDAITWSQFSFPSNLEAGVGLGKTGTTLNVLADYNGGLEFIDDSLNIKTGGIINAMLAGSIDVTKINTGVVDNTEFNYLNGVTSAIQTQFGAKQDTVSGVSSTEIGFLNGVTSAIQTQFGSKQDTVANVSSTEIGYLDGATSNIQSQIGAKQDVVANVSSTEISYLDGTTSAIQTQLNTLFAKVPKSNNVALTAGSQTVTFTSAYTDANYEVICEGRTATDKVEIYVTAQTANGFTITVPIDCTVHWIAVYHE